MNSNNKLIFPRYFEEYDKYCNKVYDKNFLDICYDYNLNNEQISSLLNNKLLEILNKRIINQLNKNICYLLLVTRNKIVISLLENDFIDYDDIIKCIKFMPACLLKINSSILNDPLFVLKLLNDKTVKNLLLKNIEYVPKEILFNEKFVLNEKNIDIIYESIKNDSSFDFSNLILYPEEILNNPKIRDLIIKNMDCVIKRIEVDQKFINHCPDFLINNKDFLNKYLKVIDPKIYDRLIKRIASIPEVQIKCNRTKKVYLSDSIDRAGYDINWKYDDDEVIEFFTLKGDFPIKSREDYYKIYDKYLDSKLSIHRFCLKYGISSENGFKKFLDRVKAEGYYDNKDISELHHITSTNFFNMSKKEIKRLLDNEITFEDFLSNKNKNFKVSNIGFYYKSVLYGDEEKYKFSCIILDYIDKNPYFLSNKFIEFLSGDNLNLAYNFKLYVLSGLNGDRNAIVKYDVNKKYKIIESLSKNWQKEDLYCKYINKDGNEYCVDDNIVEQAIAYSNDHNYYICLREMIYLCKKITLGEIVYKKEMEEQKEEMIDTIISLLEDAKTIEDYLNIMDKEKTKILRK